MTIEVSTVIIISLISVAFTVYFGLKNSKRTDSKDIEERVKENTRINMKLDETINLTRETKGEITSLRDDIKSHNDRLIKVEESVKSAHHRISTMEERLNGGKEQ